MGRCYRKSHHSVANRTVVRAVVVKLTSTAARRARVVRCGAWRVPAQR